MIVVINPSGSAGRSFKGLHAYCAHDPDRAATSERVEWMDMRNIAANDPEQAWKVMAATAGAQNELKRAAGVRAGRASKEGTVMHVVLSFDKDEPADRETMQEAANEFLSQLGADPAKMRGKAKPKRRQFADEHQVVMYAHRDTDNAHLHLMINTVHPEHGVKLPSSNNQLKAQKWALDFSMRHGTDDKTPARAENADMRDAGEYVKGERRKSRNLYELEKALAEAGNDNDRIKAALDEERKKDAALALRGRNLAQLQARAREMLVDGHRERKAALARQLQRESNKARSEVRERYRPEWRALQRHQEEERKTFDMLETSFFGRASNMARTVRLSSKLIAQDETGIITRTFRILTNAGRRKEYFEEAQKRSRNALQRRQVDEVSETIKDLKGAHNAKLAANRAVLEARQAELAKAQQSERAQLKSAWRDRSRARNEAIERLAQQIASEREADATLSRGATSDRMSKLKQRYSKSAQNLTREQDNNRDRGNRQK